MHPPNLLPLYCRCLCIALLCFASVSQLYAQAALGGDWEGLSTQENGNRFALSLHLEQRGDSVNGIMEEISATDAGQYVLLRVTGRQQGDSLQLFDLSVISENSPKNIAWCRKIRRGRIYQSAEGISIRGNWDNDGDYTFKKTRLRVNLIDHCLPGNFVLYRKKPVDYLTPVPSPANISLPPKRSATAEEITLTKVAVRKDVVKQRIEVFSDSLRLQFYDSGDIDGDTITVIYNGQVLLAQRGLTARPLEITVPVNRGSENKLLMFADNEGSIPPNTALLIFYDLGKEHLVRLDADARANAVVSIFRE